jgi:SM-20-related protein
MTSNTSVPVDLPAPTHDLRVDGREIIVLDDVLPANEVQQLGESYERAPYARTELDGPEHAHARTFALDFSLEDFQQTALFRAMQGAVDRHFPGEEFTPHRSHMNLTVYGDLTFPHRDGHATRTDVTALYFANPRWEREWGGELLFFDSRGDSLYAIRPRPGRLVLFRGSIEHRVGIPTRECYEARLTLACKFKAPGDLFEPADA